MNAICSTICCVGLRVWTCRFASLRPQVRATQSSRRSISGTQPAPNSTAAPRKVGWRSSTPSSTNMLMKASGKPFILTSGTLMADADREATEEDGPSKEGAVLQGGVRPSWCVEDYAKRGVRGMIMRLPHVLAAAQPVLVTYAIEAAHQKGVSAYIGDGSNRWAAAHVSDVARLYVLALEKERPARDTTRSASPASRCATSQTRLYGG